MSKGTELSTLVMSLNGKDANVSILALKQEDKKNSASNNLPNLSAIEAEEKDDETDSFKNEEYEFQVKMGTQSKSEDQGEDKEFLDLGTDRLEKNDKKINLHPKDDKSQRQVNTAINKDVSSVRIFYYNSIEIVKVFSSSLVPENAEQFSTMTSAITSAGVQDTKSSIVIKANDTPVNFQQPETRFDEGPVTRVVSLTVHRDLKSDEVAPVEIMDDTEPEVEERFQVLAKKVPVLYKLAQLSKQYHYDFVLRALKSVLVMTGESKRGSPDLYEDVVLIRALRGMNLPKFVFEDVPLSLWLIGDLFPGLDCPRVRYPNFNDAVEAVLKDNGYIQLPLQVDKVFQLYETMMTHHTTMIVGPTGGGKSVVINTIAHSQTRLGTKLFTINPKYRSEIELYGNLDPITRDWTEVLLSNIFREVNKPMDKNKRKYIVYDEDVDALLVENMADKRLMTLANEERILPQKHCAMFFEVYDQQYASPVTVSHCGKAYVDPKNLGFLPFWQKYCYSGSSKMENENLMRLYEKDVPILIDKVVDGILDGRQGEKMRLIVPLTNLNMVAQLVNMLDSLLVKELAEADKWESVFIQALVWSIGAGLLEDGRLQFDANSSLLSPCRISMMMTNMGLV